MTDAKGLGGFRVTEAPVGQVATTAWMTLSGMCWVKQTFLPLKNCLVSQDPMENVRTAWHWSHGKMAGVWHGMSASLTPVIHIDHIWWWSGGRGSKEDVKILAAGSDLHLHAHSNGNPRTDEQGRIRVFERTWLEDAFHKKLVSDDHCERKRLYFWANVNDSSTF